MNISRTVAKLLIFAVVTAMFTVGVVVVFGQVRLGYDRTYKAVFEDASGLESTEFVRVAGVEVGKVKSVELRDGSSALVEFSIEKQVPITEASMAAVRYENLIGDHYLELLPGAGSNAPLPVGSTIPAERTSPALDLDALINGFRPLFKALDPDQVNRLSSSLVTVFQGQGGTISNFLRQTAQLTSTLSDRDQLIGSVIENLNTVLSTVDDRKDNFDQGIDQLQQLITGLSQNSDPIGDALVHIDSASASVADLLTHSRPDIANDIEQTGRVAKNVAQDQDYVDRMLTILPESYRRLARLGLYGDFFTFYLCDVQLKVNGPDGNPVFVPIIGQRAGRCTPP